MAADDSDAAAALPASATLARENFALKEQNLELKETLSMLREMFVENAKLRTDNVALEAMVADQKEIAASLSRLKDDLSREMVDLKNELTSSRSGAVQSSSANDLALHAMLSEGKELVANLRNAQGELSKQNEELHAQLRDLDSIAPMRRGASLKVGTPKEKTFSRLLVTKEERDREALSKENALLKRKVKQFEGLSPESLAIVMAEKEELSRENAVLKGRVGVNAPCTIIAQARSQNVEIIYSKMPQDMQQHAIERTRAALIESKDYDNVANAVRHDFKNRYGGVWHCIVVEDMHSGFAVTITGAAYLWVSFGDLKMLLFTESPGHA